MQINYTLPTRFSIIPVSSFIDTTQLREPSKHQSFKNYIYNSLNNQSSFEVDNDKVMVEYQLDAVGNFIGDIRYTTTDEKIKLFTQYFFEANPKYKDTDFKYLLIPNDQDLSSYLKNLPGPSTPSNEIAPTQSEEYIKGIPNDHLKYYAAGVALALVLIFSKSKKKKRKK